MNPLSSRTAPVTAPEHIAASMHAAFGGDPAAGVRHAGAALAAAQAVGDEPATVQAAAWLAHHRWREGRPAQALPLARKALARVEALGDEALAIRLRHTIVMALHDVGLPGEALEPAHEALARAQRLGDAVLLSLSLNRLAVLHDAIGDPEQAAALLAESIEALPARDEGGQPAAEPAELEDTRFSAHANLAATLNTRAAQHAAAGEPAEQEAAAVRALDHITRAKAIAGDNRVRRLFCCGIEFEAHETLGHRERMAAALAEYEHLAAESGLETHTLQARLLRAQWHLASGDAAAACAVLDAIDEAEFGADRLGVLMWLEARHRACKAAGRTPEALWALERLLDGERTLLRQRVRLQGRVMLEAGALLRARRDAERERHRATMAERLAADAAEAARRDALTGLPNRRALDEHLARRFAAAAAARAGAGGPVGPWCLALVDADHFKRINDAGGHAAGDTVLRHLAALLAEGVRGGDYAARLGGEEFVVVIEGELPAARAVCERLRAAAEAAHWPLAAGARVTLSIGVASAQAGDDAAALLARADTAMYRAKRDGRNRVEAETGA